MDNFFFKNFFWGENSFQKKFEISSTFFHFFTLCIVSKVRHKPTLRIVAIKKFIESEDDKNVRKIALREVRALRKLKHDNLVALLEVFRRKKRLYLVFEFVDRTVLDELERSPNGLSETFTCKIIYQVLKGTQYMHDNSYIHRDIKPETS